MNRKNACPRCGFNYAWDGVKCSHCHFQAPMTECAGNPPEEDLFAALVNQACYGEIGPHIQALQNEQDPVRILAMMEPHHYRRFAENTVQSLAALTYELMGHIYEHLTSANGRDHPEVQELRPHFGFQNEIRSRLGSCGGTFVNKLYHFEGLFMGFQHKLQTAGTRAEAQGQGLGLLGAIIGGFVLGPVGAFAGAFGAGYLGGSLIQSEIQKDAEQLHQAFLAMLGEYDNFLNELRGVCYQMLTAYHHAVESTVQRVVCGATPKKLPF